MKDKHFEIFVKHGHHAFTFVCTTIAEAYDAIVDIKYNMHCNYTIIDDLDEIMVMLVRMKNGDMLSHIENRWGIIVRDGEV